MIPYQVIVSTSPCLFIVATRVIPIAYIMLNVLLWYHMWM
jgi:hypothetical protein